MGIQGVGVVFDFSVEWFRWFRWFYFCLLVVYGFSFFLGVMENIVEQSWGFLGIKSFLKENKMKFELVKVFWFDVSCFYIRYFFNKEKEKSGC